MIVQIVSAIFGLALWPFLVWVWYTSSPTRGPIRGVPRRVEQASARYTEIEADGQLDDADDTGLAEMAEVIDRSRGKLAGTPMFWRICRLAAAHARVKLGSSSRTEANAKCAGRIIRTFLEERGVRPTHIVQIEGPAIELFFMPTEGDILARQFAASSAVVEARSAHDAGYVTHVDQPGVFGLIWRRRVVTYPPVK